MCTNSSSAPDWECPELTGRNKRYAKPCSIFCK